MRNYRISGAYVIAMVFASTFSVQRGLAQGSKPSGTLDQCRNGVAASPNDCTDLGGSLGWVNGNAGASNAHNREGGTIAYRIRLSNLKPNTDYTLEMGYDSTNSSKHALDYLTSANRPAPWGPATTVDPCAGAGISVAGSPVTTCPITVLAGTVSFGSLGTTALPALNASQPDCQTPGALGYSGSADDNALQPCSSQANQTADQKEIAYLGAANVVIDPIKSGDLSASQSESAIVIHFRATESNALFSWGGHIATRFDWGFIGTVPQTAGGITGSPYHMRLHGICAGGALTSCSDGGNQDRSLAASAVTFPSSIKIEKTCDPSDAVQSFTFNVTQQPASGPFTSSFTVACGSFKLQDNITAFGTYKISEASQSGWTFTGLTCSGGGGNTTISGQEAAIGLDQAEEVDCVFTNRQTGHIITKKLTEPSGAIQSFEFDPSWSATDFFLTDTHTNDSGGLASKTAYSVNEVSIPSNWSLTDVACSVTTDAGTQNDTTFDDTGSSASITNLGPGDTITCTFTNTQKANITISKICNPSTPSGDPTFSTSYGTSTALGSTGPTLHCGSTNLAVVTNTTSLGDYYLKEPAATGWALTGISCNTDAGAVIGKIVSGVFQAGATNGYDGGDDTAKIDLDAGDNAGCTFTNTENADMPVNKVSTLTGVTPPANGFAVRLFPGISTDNAAIPGRLPSGFTTAACALPSCPGVTTPPQADLSVSFAAGSLGIGGDGIFRAAFCEMSFPTGWTFADIQVSFTGGSGNSASAPYAVEAQPADSQIRCVDLVVNPGTTKLEITVSDTPKIQLTIVKKVKTIVYEYDVTNSGIAPLTAVSVSDDKLGSIPFATNCTSDSTTQDLAVGQKMTCTASKDVSGIDSGNVTNVGTASGKDPGNNTISDTDDANVTWNSTP